MLIKTMLVWMLCVAVMAGSAFGSDAAKSEIDSLRKEFDALRKQADATPLAKGPSVDRVLDNRYGPNAPVTTKDGKFKFGMLNQIWYEAFSKDNRGLFDKAGSATAPDTNEATQNSTFRVRRTEMYFTMDIHENIQAFINWDPDREAQTYPVATDNQATQSIFKKLNNVSPEFDAANGPKLGSTSQVSLLQTGGGAPNRTLKDAWINYHGVVPHTDFQVGLFKARLGEEGIRNPGELDFAERAMGTFWVDDKQRELGAFAHTTWWDDRFQTWTGVLDGAGNFYGSAGGGNYNRADDNSSKDLNYRVLVRPLWNDLHECGNWWGRMELGMSSQMGYHGGAGGHDPVDNPINGLNRRSNFAVFHDGWFYYAFANKLSGWWVRSEAVWIKDRNAPGAVADLNGNGVSLGGNAQGNPEPFSTNGFFVSTGYKLSDSIFAESCNSWLKPFEFAFRYDTFGNVETATQNNPAKTWVYKTTVGSAGVNYYIKGHNAKIQAMFNYVRQPDGDAFHFHNVQSNSFVLAWQVYF